MQMLHNVNMALAAETRQQVALHIQGAIGDPRVVTRTFSRVSQSGSHTPRYHAHSHNFSRVP